MELDREGDPKHLDAVAESARAWIAAWQSYAGQFNKFYPSRLDDKAHEAEVKKINEAILRLMADAGRFDSFTADAFRILRAAEHNVRVFMADSEDALESGDRELARKNYNLAKTLLDKAEATNELVKQADAGQKTAFEAQRGAARRANISAAEPPGGTDWGGTALLVAAILALAMVGSAVVRR